jgi:uncharacterized protein YeaO (DUF488 family)
MLIQNIELFKKFRKKFNAELLKNKELQKLNTVIQNEHILLENNFNRLASLQHSIYKKCNIYKGQ